MTRQVDRMIFCLRLTICTFPLVGQTREVFVAAGYAEADAYFRSQRRVDDDGEGLYGSLSPFGAAQGPYMTEAALAVARRIEGEGPVIFPGSAYRVDHHYDAFLTLFATGPREAERAAKAMFDGTLRRVEEAYPRVTVTAGALRRLREANF